ncbi:MAG: hypothetical protein NVS1B4_00830 [Gemmatimonadaceae bacterium]
MEENEDAGDGQQRCRVTDPPQGADTGGARQRALPADDGRHGQYVVRVRGVPHPEDEAKEESDCGGGARGDSIDRRHARSVAGSHSARDAWQSGGY